MPDLSLEKQYDLINDKAFGKRVSMGMYRIAREILVEPTDTIGYLQRVNLARTILLQDVDVFIKYGAFLISDARVVTSGVTTSSQIPDSMILVGIRDMWNALAGVV